MAPAATGTARANGMALRPTNPANRLMLIPTVAPAGEEASLHMCLTPCCCGDSRRGPGRRGGSGRAQRSFEQADVSGEHPAAVVLAERGRELVIAVGAYPVSPAGVIRAEDERHSGVVLAQVDVNRDGDGPRLIAGARVRHVQRCPG